MVARTLDMASLKTDEGGMTDEFKDWVCSVESGVPHGVAWDSTLVQMLWRCWLASREVANVN